MGFIIMKEFEKNYKKLKHKEREKSRKYESGDKNYKKEEGGE